jgi:glycosyltransferase involved in cell wall biosynthesis
MRILFFTHYFPPEGNAPASRTYETCKRWVRDGHEVCVITGVPSAPEGVVYEGYRKRLWPQRERMDGIEVLRVWSYVAPNRRVLRRILNFVSFMCTATLSGLFVRRPDVVIATSPQLFCGWAGVLVTRVRRLPFVLEIRDLWPDSIIAVEALRQGLVLQLLYKLEAWMYAAADHIVTVGEGYRRELLAKGAAPDKVTVVPNGIDTELFYPLPPDPELRRDLDLEGRFVCSYLGTIGMACGLRVVLEAAKILRERGVRDVVFMMVGDGAEREALEEQARAEGLTEVRFLGRQPKNRVPRLLALSDAALVHLKREPLFSTVLPSKIFEAAAMGRPILLGVEGHAAKLVTESDMGLCFEPENAEELVAALDRLRADPELSRKLGENGQQLVTKCFNRDSLARQFLVLLESLVGRSARRQLQSGPASR